MRTLLIILLLALPHAALPEDAGIVLIDGGDWQLPIVREDNGDSGPVDDFLLDSRQVTNAEFLDFVQAHPEWRRDRAPGIFRDRRYLAHWPGPDTLGGGNAAADRPVTRVSWYAARAYCRELGGRLPSMIEWEYASERQRRALGISDDDYAHELFGWYGNPSAGNLRAVADGPAGGLGIHDLHGLVLEWVEDFQLVLGRGDDIDLLTGSCGDTARFLPEFDEAHYATFLRFQSRSNYQPDTTTSTLGFRCAYDPE
ncbi:formylglycine-generating enzyme family protein [Wenzhouxiangella sp. EGI_FJ10409]|uniref:formylglycine-generating enzyme family protein n=1 Tax=Wenzhouxiangella sp. EGI_FJ10409 TaxID=3243767 RepID=UPI0035DC1E73